MSEAKIADVQSRLHKLAAYLSNTDAIENDSFVKAWVLEVLSGKHDLVEVKEVVTPHVTR